MALTPAARASSRWWRSLRRNGGFVLLTLTMLVHSYVAPSSRPLWYRVTMAVASAWIGVSFVAFLSPKQAFVAGTAFIIGSAGWLFHGVLEGVGLAIYVVTGLSALAIGAVTKA